LSFKIYTGDARIRQENYFNNTQAELSISLNLTNQSKCKLSYKS